MIQPSKLSLPTLDDLRIVVDQSPLPILIVCLPNQRVGGANAALADLVGSPGSAVIGLRPSQVFHGADGRRSRLALSALSDGAVDAYRADRTLHTDSGPVAVSEWARRVEVIGGAVAVVILVADTEPKLTSRSIGEFLTLLRSDSQTGQADKSDTRD